MMVEHQSYADLLTACGEQFRKRSRTKSPSGERNPNGRAQHRNHSDSWDSGSTGSGRSTDLLNIMARLCLRHEDQLNIVNLDRSFLLFAQCGRGNLMPLLLEKSRLWNLSKQTGEITQSLRQTLSGLHPGIDHEGGQAATGSKRRRIGDLPDHERNDHTGSSIAILGLECKSHDIQTHQARGH